MNVRRESIILCTSEILKNYSRYATMKISFEALLFKLATTNYFVDLSVLEVMGLIQLSLLLTTPFHL